MKKRSGPSLLGSHSPKVYTQSDRFHANARSRKSHPRAYSQITKHTVMVDESSTTQGFDTTQSGFAPTMQGIFRIGTSLLFMQHGAQKLFGVLGGSQVESFFSLMGLAGVMEFFGGLLVALGLFTRPVAGILALEMVVAYFMAHAPNGVFPIQDGGGELALLFMLGFALIAALGPGAFNLDDQMQG